MSIDLQRKMSFEVQSKILLFGCFERTRGH